MDANGITIQRFSTVYCCTTELTNGLRMRDRLDAVVRRSIATKIETMCADLMQREANAVWLIRKLEVDCAINAAWDDDRITRSWAKQLVSSLGVELAAGGSENVLRFDSPGVYLARFVTDLASGDAWSKWYYRRFNGLAALPTSSAIRTALLDAEATSIAALHALSVKELTVVLYALSSDDTLMILRMLANISDLVSEEEWLAIARPHAIAISGFSIEDPRWALSVFAAASREHEIGGGNLLAAIAALSLQALRARIHIRKNVNSPTLSVPEWAEAFGGQQALSKLPQSMLETWEPSVVNNAERRCTPFGGGFLLLPLLLQIPIEGWVQGWSELANAPAERVMRALLLAKCYGRKRCMQFLRDPLWLDMLGLPAQTDWHDVARDLSQHGGEVQRAWRKGLQASAAEYGEAPSHVKIVQLDKSAWRIRHDDLGYWHSLMPAARRADVAESDSDAEYLASPEELSLPATWDRLLSLAAQQLLRRFARRLPGFALSHFDYLYRNFLAVSAEVETEDERYVVRLSRPPLALILSLTGMTRTEYDLPWQPGRCCALYADDS